MRTALYFPHTEVRSRSLIRTALLTWDNVEYIAPFAGYQPDYQDRDIARAMDVIGKKRVPSRTEQDRAHEYVVDLLQSGVPETFKYMPQDGARTPEYEIWPQKLAEKTWRLLGEQGLTDGFIYTETTDYPTSQAAGLTLMAILADVLAGETRARITDRGLAYATIANAPGITADAQEADRVVPLTFKGIAIDNVPLDRLIDFREREAKSGSGDYQALRHKYQNAIEEHLERISSVRIGSKDREELDRIFADDMERDLVELKKELGFAKKDALLSRDIVALVIVGGALIAAAAAAPPFVLPGVIAGGSGVALIGGLLGAGNKLAKARYDVLRNHKMAYLYQLQTDLRG